MNTRWEGKARGLSGRCERLLSVSPPQHCPGLGLSAPCSQTQRWSSVLHSLQNVRPFQTDNMEDPAGPKVDNISKASKGRWGGSRKRGGVNRKRGAVQERKRKRGAVQDTSGEK